MFFIAEVLIRSAWKDKKYDFFYKNSSLLMLNKTENIQEIRILRLHLGNRNTIFRSQGRKICL